MNPPPRPLILILQILASSLFGAGIVALSILIHKLTH